MTIQEIIERLKRLSTEKDKEFRHEQADGLIQHALDTLGQKALADAYRDSLNGVWYA